MTFLEEEQGEVDKKRAALWFKTEKQQRHQEKEGPIQPGQKLRFTQSVESHANHTMPAAFWVFHLPYFTNFGHISMQPKVYSSTQEMKQQKAAGARLGKGSKGSGSGGSSKEGMVKYKDMRGTLYQEDPQTLFWNIGPLFPGKIYTISFYQGVAPPPPGVEVVQVKSAFQPMAMEAVPGDSDDVLPVIQCRKFTNVFLSPVKTVKKGKE